MHLRENLFLVGYSNNDIEVKTLEDNEPVQFMNIEYSEPMVDLDFYRDEKEILVGFPGELIYMVNLPAQTVSSFPHFQTFNLS